MEKQKQAYAKNILDNPYYRFEKMISELDDEELLEILLKTEKSNKNRKQTILLIYNALQKVKLHKYGYNIDMITKLLNAPWREDGRCKEPFTEKQRRQIIERDGGCCTICYNGTSKLIVHHIDPQGPATEENLITLCASCHAGIHRFLRAKGHPYYG